MAEPERRWQFGPPLDCFDRGFQFGDGVFETIDYQSGGAWLLEQHRLRLWASAERLGLIWPADAATLRLLEAVEARAGSLPRAVIKLFFSAAPARRGYGRPWPHPGLLRASVTALGGVDAAPVNVDVLTHTLQGAQPLDGLKHMNRLPQVLLSSRSPKRLLTTETAAEQLVCHPDGTIEEGTFTNFFYQHQGGRFTPPIHSGVAGVLRAALLAAPDLSISERALHISELPQIERCWIGNSLMGLRPVSRLYCDRMLFDFPIAGAPDPLLDWQMASRRRDRQSLHTLHSGPESAAAGDPLSGSS